MKTVREMKNFRSAFYSFHPRLPTASPCKTVRNSVTYSLIKKLRSRDGVYVITHHPLPTPCTPLFSFSLRSFIFSNSYSSYENPLFLPPAIFDAFFLFFSPFSTPKPPPCSTQRARRTHDDKRGKLKINQHFPIPPLTSVDLNAFPFKEVSVMGWHWQTWFSCSLPWAIRTAGILIRILDFFFVWGGCLFRSFFHFFTTFETL